MIVTLQNTNKITLKRAIDFTLSFIALILLSPVLLLVAILVKTKLGSPVFFKQIRPGKHGIPFKMIKFRSMTNERDKQGNLLPNEKRLTTFGQWLRATSLDELPELINVVKGNMSLVGPRPLLVEYLPYYTREQNKRHSVKPGITGWAQINGRNALTWEEKLSLDVWYVENKSLMLDFKILFLTVWKVLKKEDITPDDAKFTMRFDEHIRQQQAQ